MRGLLVATGFLTRIPVPVRVFDDERAKTQSLAWYPLVGLLLGVGLAAFAWCLQGAPALLAAALVLLAWVAVTGALHLDGLADSADAWIGGLGDPARTLEIMKDPRSGPAGVVALVLVLLLKFAALASLPVSAITLLPLAPLLARAMLTLAFVTTPYVRQGGLGSALVAAPRVACWLSVLAAGGICIVTGWIGVIALLTALLVFALWRRACLRRIGGTTGDTAGALAELVEAAVLVAIALASTSALFR
ncbi:adenosylcobinamide-GDP ribazoletransferase [Lysobacter tyrosinilyticus]